MRKRIDNLIIKTQILETINKKYDHRKKKRFIKKSQQNIFNSKSCKTSKII